MHLTSLLEIVSDSISERTAIAHCNGGGLTYRELLERSQSIAGYLEREKFQRLISVDVNSEAIPVALFAAATAGIPFIPVNYRLADHQLSAILTRASPGLAFVDPSVLARLDGDIGGMLMTSRVAFLDTEGAIPLGRSLDADDPAVLLFTSGTTGEPKAAVLRHRHLTSYIIETVEFLGADQHDAALVCVPPYHIAGIATVLSSVWSGRRLVYLPQFSPEDWVDLAVAESVTHAMLVPTMLGRILDVLEHRKETLPALQHLSYGGGRMPVSVLERTLDLLPRAGLVNAYGLTETSSTVSLLGPEGHREAFNSTDPQIRNRLHSVGRPLSAIEIEIRDADGGVLGAGELGEIWVRGPQVSGEYLDREPRLRTDGWLATNDGGWLDADGYLFVDGRLDDVIVRGGENLSPGEIEDVLLLHSAVADAAIVGLPDDEWGEEVVGVLVLKDGSDVSEEELMSWVSRRLRSTRAPKRIEFRTELPYSETGKLLRRVLKAELNAGVSA